MRKESTHTLRFSFFKTLPQFRNCSYTPYSFTKPTFLEVPHTTSMQLPQFHNFISYSHTASHAPSFLKIHAIYQSLPEPVTKFLGPFAQVFSWFLKQSPDSCSPFSAYPHPTKVPLALTFSRLPYRLPYSASQLPTVWFPHTAPSHALPQNSTHFPPTLYCLPVSPTVP